MAGTAIFEAYDARAEGRRRLVEVTRSQVAIARRVDGVDMCLRLSPRAYRGVALTLLCAEATDFLYCAVLLHADPDLNVTLSQSDNEASARENWRRWAHALMLPRLVERVEGEYEVDRSPAAPMAFERRRGRATLRRRNRFLARRKMGQPVRNTVSARP